MSALNTRLRTARAVEVTERTKMRRDPSKMSKRLEESQTREENANVRSGRR